MSQICDFSKSGSQFRTPAVLLEYNNQDSPMREVKIWSEERAARNAARATTQVSTTHKVGVR